MPKKAAYMRFALGLVLLTSCSPGKTYLEGVEVPIEEMNVDLNLYAPPEANTWTMGDSVRIVIENTSSQPISFANDFGIHLYRKIDGSWAQINNNFGYPDGDVILLPKAEEFLGGKIIVVLPEVLVAEPTEVRIVVVGRAQNRPVAGFIDVTLNP